MSQVRHHDVTDEELMAAVAAGDEAAFGRLFRRHASELLGFLVNVVRRRDLAEEILQDVFLQVWRDAGRFDARRAGCRSWLFLLARSRAADALRSLRARVRREEARAEHDVRAARPDPTERFEARATVTSALGALSPEQKECVVLSFFEGLSLSQVSDRLGIPLGTAKSRFLYGMRRLRESMAAQEQGHV